MGYLMQKILAPIRNPGVKISGLTRPAFPLRFCNPFLLAAIPSWRFNLGTIGTGCQRFQSQIDSDLLRSGTDFFFGNFADQIDVPAFAGVLTEAATFNRARKITAVPKAEGATGIAHGIVHDLDPGRLEGNPTRRPLPTPAQFAFLGLLATGRVLLTHCLHGLRMPAQSATVLRHHCDPNPVRRLGGRAGIGRKHSRHSIGKENRGCLESHGGARGPAGTSRAAAAGGAGRAAGTRQRRPKPRAVNIFSWSC